jgi:hypothetical protein
MYYFLKMRKLFFTTKNTHKEKNELREEQNTFLNLAARWRCVDKLIELKG